MDGGNWFPRSIRAYGDRKTRIVCHHHDERSLTSAGSPTVPSRASRPVRNRRSSSSRSRTSTKVPLSFHCKNRRLQTSRDGYARGSDRQLEPLRITQRIPSRIARFSARGRPRPDGWRASGMHDSTANHCSSVSPLTIPLFGSHRASPPSQPVFPTV